MNNRRFTNLVWISACSLAATLSGSALGETVSQSSGPHSGFPVPLSFNTFDDSLGTLTGVTLQIDVSMSGTGQAIDPDGSSSMGGDFGGTIEGSATASLNTGLEVSGSVLASQSGPLCFDFMAPCSVNLNLADSDTQTATSGDVATYQGPGTIDGVLNGNFFSIADPTGNISEQKSVTVTLIYEYTAPSCPGDADGDNDVDLSDLALLLSNFGRTGSGLPGDVDADGDVDLSDLAEVLGLFGRVC